MHHLDPHERPPDGIRNVYKKYQKMGLEQLNQDTEIIDMSSQETASLNNKVRVVKQHEAEQLTATFRAFAGQDMVALDPDLPSSMPVYEHEDMPGGTFFYSASDVCIFDAILSTLCCTSFQFPMYSHASLQIAHVSISSLL